MLEEGAGLEEPCASQTALAFAVAEAFTQRVARTLSLTLLTFKVDYRTRKEGKSPVVSRQKLSVARGVWRPELPRVTTSRLQAALSYPCERQWCPSTLHIHRGLEKLLKVSSSDELCWPLRPLRVSGRSTVVTQAKTCTWRAPRF